MLRIFFTVSCFMDFGGVEERVTSLAIALHGKGHEAWVFSRSPVSATNQYYQRLRTQHIRVISPPQPLADLAGDWDTKARLIDRLIKVGSPLLAVSAVLFAVTRKRRLGSAWHSATGATRRLLGSFILHDYRDWLFHRTLDLYALRASPDVVHAHGYLLGFWQGVEWGGRHGWPTLYEEHSSPSSGFDYDPQAISSPFRPALMIAVSAAGAAVLRSRFSAGMEVEIVPPIIEQMTIADHDEQRTTEAGDNLTITCNARLSPEKGLEYLLLAAQRLVPRYPHLRFAIHGDGPLKEDLLNLAVQLGLSERVQFSGKYQRSELPRIMQETDIFVLPSLTEALGLVIIEAMACGKPIVATNVGGIPDLITDGVTGLLVSPGNAEALAEALAALIDDPARRLRLGQAAYQEFRTKGFTGEAVADRMLAIYDRAIEKYAKG